jgi:hypothetical protein
MHMQMVHLLTPVLAGVDHNSKAPLWVGECTLLQGQLTRFDHDFAHDGLMRWAQLGHRRDVGFGDHQKMDRRPWFDVVKGQNVLVFMNFSGRNLTRNNFAKDAILVVTFMPFRVIVLSGVAHGERGLSKSKKTG